MCDSGTKNKLCPTVCRCTSNVDNQASCQWSQICRFDAISTCKSLRDRKRCTREKPLGSGPVRYRLKRRRTASPWTSWGAAKARDKHDVDRNMWPTSFQCCCKSKTSHKNPHQQRPQILAMCRIAAYCEMSSQAGCPRKRRTQTNRVVHCTLTKRRLWQVGRRAPIDHLTVEVIKALNMKRRLSTGAARSSKILRLEKKATAARRIRL